MKITLKSTSTVDTVEGKFPARIWEGETESGIPVKCWITAIQPQTHDEAKSAEFARDLKEVPRSREMTSFDLRLVL